MFGDHRAGAPYPDPVKVGGDLDAPTHRDRVHRVVIAVQADVVIARQPGRVSPPDAGPTGGRASIAALSASTSVGWAAAQCAVLTVIGPHQPILQLGIESVGEVNTRPGRSARSR
jgi:hypothetical protein